MSIVLDGDKGVTQNTTEAARLPSGTTNERPANPVAGMIRFNTDLGYFEGYDPAEEDWLRVSDFKGPFIATGGTETTITDNGVDYKVHTFTSSGTFEVLSGENSIEYFIVGGGAPGKDRRNSNDNAGGGGAGGVLQGSKLLQIATYAVTVGSAQGGDSVVQDVATAFGGGSAGGRSNGGDGGSGGGGGWENGSGGSGTSNQGHDGGDGQLTSSGCSGRLGGGGGGAGGPGDDAANGGNGGPGITSTFSGTSVYYAEGGKGGVSGQVASAPIPNRGHGGTSVGCSGGTGDPSASSGIVIIRYPI